MLRSETRPQRPYSGSDWAPATSRMLTPPSRPSPGSPGALLRKRHGAGDSLPQRRAHAGLKMAAGRYRRFLKLCEEWPVDDTKRGRDLGAYLRQRVAQAFREGENTQVTGLWGLPSAGRRLGRGGGKKEAGAESRSGQVATLRTRAPSLPASTCVRTLLPAGEPPRATTPRYSVLSSGCTL